MKESISNRSSTWILAIIVLMIIVVAYIIDDFCYKKEQDLTLQLAGSSMVYAETLINNYGSIERNNTQLFAGNKLLNNDTSIVDLVRNNTGFGCTIFLDSTRISTTATESGSITRAIGTYANKEVIELVYKKGEEFRGITHTIGKDWVIIYRPLKDINNGIVGMLATYIDLEQFVDSRFHFRLFSSIVFVFLVALILSYGLWNKHFTKNIKKVATNEIQARNEELESVNKALDGFIYRASHDLKAPITNIQSMLRMLPSVIPIEDNATSEMVLKNLNRSANDLELIIGDLLEISRIDRSSGEKEVKVDLKVLVDDLIWNLGGQIEKSNGQINTDFSNCPRITAPPMVLRNILTSLITNAIKYRSLNRALEISISSFMKDNKQCISIADNGIGIDLEKYRKKLFQMFSRLHPHLDIEGNGIGLYMVKKMLDSIQANIEIESSVDKGTRILITFRR